jgi:hypothetical protein
VARRQRDRRAPLGLRPAGTRATVQNVGRRSRTAGRRAVAGSICTRDAAGPPNSSWLALASAYACATANAGATASASGNSPTTGPQAPSMRRRPPPRFRARPPDFQRGDHPDHPAEVRRPVLKRDEPGADDTRGHRRGPRRQSLPFVPHGDPSPVGDEHRHMPRMMARASERYRAELPDPGGRTGDGCGPTDESGHFAAASIFLTNASTVVNSVRGIS